MGPTKSLTNLAGFSLRVAKLAIFKAMPSSRNKNHLINSLSTSRDTVSLQIGCRSESLPLLRTSQRRDSHGHGLRDVAVLHAGQGLCWRVVCVNGMGAVTETNETVWLVYEDKFSWLMK